MKLDLYFLLRGLASLPATSDGVGLSGITADASPLSFDDFERVVTMIEEDVE